MWEAGTLLTREQAISAIKAKATAEGYKGSFKVYYNETLIDTPSTLPEQVDMALIKLASVLNQA